MPCPGRTSRTPRAAATASPAHASRAAHAYRFRATSRHRLLRTDGPAAGMGPAASFSYGRVRSSGRASAVSSVRAGVRACGPRAAFLSMPSEYRPWGAGRIQRRYYALGVDTATAPPRRHAIDCPARAPSARRHASTTVGKGAASEGVQAAPGSSRGERGFGRRAGYAASYRTVAPGSGGAHRTSCSCRAAEVRQDRLGRQGQHRESSRRGRA